MDDHIYKIIQLAGSSPDSIENAIPLDPLLLAQ